jgi:hypothetical protein
VETFLFPFHVPTHSYPKGDGFKFGRGYEFSAAPQEPVQRRFTLNFNAMQWFFNSSGVAINSTLPTQNIMALDEFYRRHYGHKKFIYPHPQYGNITVKFAADVPFEMPKGVTGGTGVVEPFSIVLIEQPL